VKSEDKSFVKPRLLLDQQAIRWRVLLTITLGISVNGACYCWSWNPRHCWTVYMLQKMLTNVI